MSTLRHPLVIVAALVILVVGAPVAWYLGSPVFLRTELNEPPITALEPGASAEPMASHEPMSAAATEDAMSHPPASPGSPRTMSDAPASPAPTAWVPGPERTGEFKGTDDFHFGRGTARLREVEPGRWVVRLEDFSVRNGPDLYVVLSPDRNGYRDDAIEVGRLKATDGSFNMRVPEGADVSKVESVLIWCKQFSHLFAVAPLAAV